MILRALCGPLVFMGAGLALSRFVPSVCRTAAPIRLAYGYLLGIGAVSGAAYALSHVAGLTVGPALCRGLLLAAPALAAADLLRERLAGGGGSRERTLGRPGVLDWCAAAVGGLVTLALLAGAVTDPATDVDGRINWNTHARFVRAERTVDARALRDREVLVVHPDYPLLMPLAQVVAQQSLGLDEDDRCIRPLYAAFFPAFLIVLWDQARRRAGRRAASVAVVCSAVLPHLSFYGAGAAGSYSDLPLACFWGAGLLLLIDRTRTTADGAAAGVLVAAAVLTKSEGSLLALLALVLGAWLIPRNGVPGRRPHREFRAVLASAVPVAAAIALVLSWRSGVETRMTQRFAKGPFPAAMVGGVSRLPRLVLPALDQMRDRSRWGLLLWVAPLIVVAGRRGLRARVAAPLGAAAVGGVSVFVAAYAVTDLDPVWLLQTSFSRCVLQQSLPLLLLMALALRPLLHDAGWRWVAPSPAGSGSPLARLAAGVGTVAAAAGFLFAVVTLADRAWAPSPWLPPYGAERVAAVLAGRDLPPPPPGWWEGMEDDPAVSAWLDEPAPGAVVASDLWVRGWCQTARGPGEVLEIRVDGARRDVGAFRRVPRPDVAAALPGLGACDRAGYEAMLRRGPADAAGDHQIRVTFGAPDGRVRVLSRSFRWR